MPFYVQACKTLTKVSKFVENGKLFLRGFLLDSSLTANKWAVTQASIPKNIHSFEGTPIVLYSNYDHPPLQEGGLVANFQYQERFAVGRITKVLAVDASRYDWIGEVTDPLAREAIEHNDIPFYTSVRLFYDKNNPLDALENWVGAHVAIVDNPAYGVDKAAISGLCYGDMRECQSVLLKAASAKKEDCGFCVKTMLLKLVNKADASEVTSSQFTESEKITSLETPSTVDTSNFVSREEYDSKVKALEAQVDAFKSVAEQAQKAADAKIAAIEEEKRVEKIKSLVSAKIVDASVADSTIKSFVDAKVSPDVVATAMSLIKESKQPDKNTFSAPADASAPKVSWYGGQRAYERSLIK